MSSGDTDDLDALVSRLNAGAPKASSGDPPVARLEQWLEEVVERNASDLLLVSGAPPSLRLNGDVTPLPEGPLRSEDIDDAVSPALAPYARRA